jgi:hypothetical protein
MPKNTIPYDEIYFHKECVARQTIRDIGGVLIKVLPHDDLEQVEKIISQVAFTMAPSNSYINGWA